jgi:molecular chaperone DnaK (HSP70)
VSIQDPALEAFHSLEADSSIVLYRSRPAVLGVNFGQSYASIAVIGKEGHANCIANEDGERQIACAISYNGEEVVSAPVQRSEGAFH